MGNYFSTTKSKRQNNYQLYKLIKKHISIQITVRGIDLPFNDDFHGKLKIMVTKLDGSKPEVLFSTHLNSAECICEDAEPEIIKKKLIGSLLVFSLSTKRTNEARETFQINRTFAIGVHTFRVLKNSGSPNMQNDQDNIITFTVTIEQMQSAIQCLDKEILCQEESNFVTERSQIVLQNMQNKLEQDGIHHLEDVPNIAIIGSGGGLRAVIGMSGAMTALENRNVLDYVMYTAGLSGSAWYLLTLYASGFNFGKFKSTHSGLKLDSKQVNNQIGHRLEHFKGNLKKMAFSILRNKEKGKYVPSGKKITVANTFGITIGDLLLRQKCECYWSDLADELDKGHVPLPLIAAVHVRDEKTLKAHHEWIEFSPYQVYIPRFGVAIGMENFGRTFQAGYITNKNERQPIHFLLGICGSAFTIIRDYRPQGYEWNTATRSNRLSVFIYLLFKKFDKHFVGTVPNFLYGIADIEKLPEDSGKTEDEDSHLKDSIWDESWRNLRVVFLNIGIVAPLIWALIHGFVDPCIAPPGSFWNRYLSEIEMGIWTLFRTFADQMLKLFLYICEDDQCIANPDSDRNDLKEEHMMLVDAGISFNSPYPTILRPTREVDLIFSFDFSDRGKDTNWPFKELEKAEKWARTRCVPFPDIHEKLAVIGVLWNLGIHDEVYVFPGKNNAPTIIHFVMINNTYRSQDPFDIHSNYGTLKFNYSAEEIKKLNLLFQHNVEENYQTIDYWIKKSIKKKVARNNKKRKEENKRKLGAQ